MLPESAANMSETIVPGGSLQSLFDPANLEKFKRVTKPAEFAAPRPKKQRTVTDEDGDEVPRKKKPKHKHRDAERLDAEENSDKVAGDLKGASVESGNDEKNFRTVFIGNLPLSQNQKTLRQLFKDFGDIESIRLRSVPYEGVAVSEHGNQDLVRKVSVNQGKIGTQKGSLNAYVVFADAESVNKAIILDNTVVGDRHIRVDKSTPTLFDPKLSVFLGGLPFFADEEELRNHFAEVNICETLAHSVIFLCRLFPTVTTTLLA
jgi:hypothetical protein